MSCRCQYLINSVKLLLLLRQHICVRWSMFRTTLLSSDIPHVDSWSYVCQASKRHKVPPPQALDPRDRYMDFWLNLQSRLRYTSSSAMLLVPRASFSKCLYLANKRIGCSVPVGQRTILHDPAPT